MNKILLNNVVAVLESGLISGTIQIPSAAMLADATILASLSFQEISAGARIKHW